MQDTAGAVPFVPGTPSNSPLGQGFPTGAPSSPGQGFASRGTDGQAVGSPSVESPSNQLRRGDDSAKACPRQGIAFTLGLLAVATSLSENELGMQGER